ncbi:hypothetical protein BS17DRAFT_84724 [Gyrodon lividus]|nr:hypothetical protein BS17DRAFT_84724 [Gyrodon lividus]
MSSIWEAISPSVADRIVLPWRSNVSSSAHDHDLQVAHSRRNSCAASEHRSVHCHRPPTSSANQLAQFRTAWTDLRRCPVHRMPPEILGIIFENCLPANESSQVTLAESPLLLGRVCSYWRTVSQSTPQLWTSLSFKYLETDLDRTGDGLEVISALNTWLRYSSNLPLSISFMDNRIFQRDTEVLIIWLLLQIKEHSERWKGIHLQFSSDYFIRLPVLFPCEFTSLESFSVHADHMGWRRGAICLGLDFTRSERLESLSYTSPDRAIHKDLLVNWTRLTKISFQYDLSEAGGESSALSRHFNTLGLCQNLTVLSMGIGYLTGRISDDLIVLPCLHTLKVKRLSRTSRAYRIIDLLVLPGLKTLHIDSVALFSWDGFGFDTYTYWHSTEFSDMLRRSACTLERLHIRDVDFRNQELVRCLTHAPALASLAFLPSPRSQPLGDLIDCLSSGPSDAPDAPPPRFPDLHTLRIGCTQENCFGPLVDMVESRSGAGAARAGVARLAEFELVVYDFIHDDHPLRRVYLDDFKRRLVRCADVDGRMVVGVHIDRPYDPVYISSLPCEVHTQDG